MLDVVKSRRQLPHPPRSCPGETIPRAFERDELSDEEIEGESTEYKIARKRRESRAGS